MCRRFKSGPRHSAKTLAKTRMKAPSLILARVVNQMPTAVRVAWWVAGNGLAALVGSATCASSPWISVGIWCVVIGIIQASAVARSRAEFVSWAGLTAIALPIAAIFSAFLAVPIGIGVGAAFMIDSTWLAIGWVAAGAGVAVGAVQAAIFYMRGVERWRLLVWPASVATGLVAVTEFAGLGAVGPCYPDRLASLAAGLAYGALTAGPLLILVRYDRGVRQRTLTASSEHPTFRS